MKTLCGAIGLSVLAFAGFGGVSLVSGQASGDKPVKTVEAERFILRDAQGNRRAELGFHEGGPSFALYDARGKVRARLTVQGDGSSRLTFLDEKGVERQTVRVSPDGVPSFQAVAKEPESSVKPAGPVEVPSPKPVRPVSVAQEKQLREVEPLYRQYCASCHSNNGQGARVRAKMPSIPDFTNGKWQSARSETQVLVSILEGRGTDMPPFSSELNAEQARSLVAYIRTLGPMPTAAPATPAGDFAARLEQLQRHWEDLDRQMQALTPERRKP